MNLSLKVENYSFEFKTVSLSKIKITVDNREVFNGKIKKEHVDFAFDNCSFKVKIATKPVLNFVHIEIFKEDLTIHSQWYSPNGETLTPEQTEVPKFAYVLVGLCAVLFGLGGAIPALFGAIGTTAIIKVFTNTKFKMKRKIFTGLGITAGSWFGAILISTIVITSIEIGSFFLDTESYLRKTAVESNKQCPQEVDDDTRLDSISSSEDTLKYHYSLKKYRSHDIDSKQFSENTRPAIVNNSKQNVLFKAMFKRDAKISFIYNGTEGNEITIITLSNKDVQN